MLNKEEFIQFILADPTGRSAPSTKAAGGKAKQEADALGGYGFDDEISIPPSSATAETSFARQLLEASGFGPAQYLATSEVILGGDPAAQHLPDKVYYWPKSAGRPYQTILFELTQPSSALLNATLFKPVKGVLEDALTRLVQDTLKGFEIGGERRKADVKQGKQDETLCVVSIRDERSKDYDSAQLICFGTVAKGEGSLETFHIREEARFWKPQQVSREHLECLYDRHFKKLASEKWQDAFITGDERKLARRLMDISQGAKANESKIQEAVIDLLDQIALSYGLRKKPGAVRRLEATDLPQDHDIGITEQSGSQQQTNPFRGMTLRDEKNRLLGYIIYCLDSKKDAETLRSRLAANNRFHNVLVVYPNGDSTGLELWQGKKPLEGKLTKRGAKFEGEGQVVNLLSRFFVVSKALVANPVQLAEELAYRARYLRAFALRELEKPEADRDEDLVALYQSFHDIFLKNESEDEAKQHDEFADSYAQTLTYGLLAARWVGKDVLAATGERFTLDNATGLLNRTSPFFKELFTQVIGQSHDASRDWLLQDITDLLDRIDIDAVFSGLKDDGLLAHDPVMHFYEPFLAAYDAAIKLQRGVFYTPQPVVSYIVRSVHELLQTEFGLADGLADTTTWGAMLKKHPGLKLPPLTDEPGEKRTISPDEMFVQILDPATGTATFLVEVIDVIFQHLKPKWAKGGLAAMPVLPSIKTGHCKQFADYWNLYVPAALLPRLHAFELMMAPYAIAHMKIGLKLAETGYRFGTEERARIYLTNALEPWQKQLPLIGFDALAHEAAAVNEIKRHKRFTVVIGNPPYTNYGQLNKIPFILDLLQDFKRGLGEKKLNLDDDFIKFIRFGQFVIQQSGVGIFGMVTNSTYLDGITHRRMRECLLESFNCGAVLDLHGSATKKETCPDGSKDENIFEIKQGVAVSLLARTTDVTRRSLYFGELWGLQETKYRRLESAVRLSQTEIVVAAPNYFFVPKSVENAEEYQRGIGVKDAFCESGPGIKTERDNVGIQQTRSDMDAVIADFKSMPVETLRTKYNLGEDSRDWKVVNAKADIRENDNPERIRPVQYRPFDFQWTWYSGKTRGFIGTPGFRIGSHMSKGPNLGFVTSRTVYGPDPWRDALVTNTICEFGIMATRPGNTAPVFPLYLYEETLAFDGVHKSIGAGYGLSKRPNFTPAFLKAIASALQLPQKGEHGLPASLTPEDIFHYAYAVFHSPGYRSRYAEFLKIDFPRLPLTGNLELFRALARLGDELTALHLLESPKLTQPITEFIGSSKEVTKVGYSNHTVWINASGTKGNIATGTSGFRGVPEAVWNFHIGGYQVCHKWLKDRRGRTLTDEDITHYQKIVVALSETIRLMAEIDEVIDSHGGWPLK